MIVPPHLTVYRGSINSRAVAQDDYASWDDLCDELEAMVDEPSGAPPGSNAFDQKLQMLAFGPYRLKKPKRLDANVQHITFLVLDVDACDVRQIEKRIKTLGVDALVYASPSDDPDGPSDARRVRVLAPIDRPIAPSECAATRLAFAEALGLRPGCGVEKALDASRCFFIGRLHDTPPREIRRYRGGRRV